MIAHVAGVPLEELAPAVTGAGTSLLLARTWLRTRLSRRREAGVTNHNGSTKGASRGPCERLAGVR